MEKVRVGCKAAVTGNVKAELLFSNDSYCFWGGVDQSTGVITDGRHGNYQQSMKGKAFAFPYGKGSSGAGLVILEMVRTGCQPAAIINLRSDPVILTGPLIAKHFYDVKIPVVNLSEEDYKKLDGASAVEFYEGESFIDIYY